MSEAGKVRALQGEWLSWVLISDDSRWQQFRKALRVSPPLPQGVGASNFEPDKRVSSVFTPLPQSQGEGGTIDWSQKACGNQIQVVVG